MLGANSSQLKWLWDHLHRCYCYRVRDWCEVQGTSPRGAGEGREKESGVSSLEDVIGIHGFSCSIGLDNRLMFYSVIRP